MSTYHLFISRSWRYSDAYDRLLNLLELDASFVFQSHAVPDPHPVVERTPAELQQAIAEHLRPCSVLLIMAGVYPTYSQWIDPEIEMAQRLSKPVIVVKPFGPERISPRVRDAAHAECGWHTRHIITAITRHA